MLKLGIISNPFAKMNKKHPEHNTRLWYTLANAGQYKITHSLSELENVCQEFFERKINIVGIVGGDGSIGLVLSKLAQAYGNINLPKILLLKGGTINFLALNLGIRTSPLTFLNDTLFYIKKNLSLYEVPIHTLEVNGRLGFIFAGGLASHFLEEFYKNKTNSAGAALKLSKYMMDGLLGGKLNGEFKKISAPHNFSITTSPQALWKKKPLPKGKEDYTLLFASTVPKLPFNIKLFKNVQLGSKEAEMIAITESGSSLLTGVLKAFGGINIINKYPGIDSVNFNQATIQSNSVVNYSLDGDLLSAKDGKINIKIGPSFIFCSPYYIAH